MRKMIVAVAMFGAVPAMAQQPPERLIQVTGSATVETLPDVATLVVYLRGEGATPDDATRQLAAKQKAVSDGLAALLGAGSAMTTGNVTVIGARGGTCADGQGYNSQPRVSTGDCAIVGYIATMQADVRTRNVAKAATAAGLAARLGANDARLQGFALSDPDAAKARAGAAAMGDARQRAARLARNAGVRLGELIEVRDQQGYDGAAMMRVGEMSAPPPPPPPPPPPVALDTKPRPIETRAQVYVKYAIVQ